MRSKYDRGYHFEYYMKNREKLFEDFKIYKEKILEE